MYKWIKTSAVLVVIVSLIFLVFSSIYNVYFIPSTQNEELKDFSSDWVMKIDSNMSEVDFPLNVNSKPNQTITLTKTLPEDINDLSTFQFEVQRQFVSIYIEDELLESVTSEDLGPIGKSFGSYWLYIRLDESYANQEIRIVLEDPFADTHIGTSYIGSKSSGLLNLFYGNIFAFLTAFFMIFLGIAEFIIFLVLRLFFKEKSKSMLYLSLFVFFAGLWSMMEASIPQLLFSNHFAIIATTYISLEILPIFFLLFVLETYEFKEKQYLYFSLLLSTIVVFVSILLQLYNLADFHQTIFLFHTSIAINSGILFIRIHREVSIYKNNQLKSFAFGIAILLGCTLLDLVTFYTNHTSDAAFYFRFGFIIFTTSLFAIIIQRFVSVAKSNLEIELLEKVAYIDVPTDLLNRTCFERDILEYRTDVRKLQNLSIFVFDLNYLKRTNDTLGHHIGDKLIQNAAFCLKSVFKKYGSIYRIGGDEFTLIMQGVSHTEAQKCLNQLQDLTKKISEETNIKTSLATGFAQFDEALDTNFDDLMMRADCIMYDNKVSMKANSDY